MTNHPHIGSSLDELLQEEGLLEHAKAVALSRVIAALPQERQQHIAARVAEIEALLRSKVEAARQSVADGHGQSNAEVEALFAARRAGPASGS